jgi:hypothetical protein
MLLVTSFCEANRQQSTKGLTPQRGIDPHNLWEGPGIIHHRHLHRFRLMLHPTGMGKSIFDMLLVTSFCEAN